MIGVKGQAVLCKMAAAGSLRKADFVFRFVRSPVHRVRKLKQLYNINISVFKTVDKMSRQRGAEKTLT